MVKLRVLQALSASKTEDIFRGSQSALELNYLLELWFYPSCGDTSVLFLFAEECNNKMDIFRILFLKYLTILVFGWMKILFCWKFVSFLNIKMIVSVILLCLNCVRDIGLD